jgi:hypothetical protein
MILNVPKTLLASALVVCVMSMSSIEGSAQQTIKAGGVLSGELHAMLNRGPEGKSIETFQIISEPRKLPEPNGLCNLETGPETFEIVASGSADISRLKELIGKQISIKANEMSCSEVAGQMSDAVVSKWSLVKTN